MSKSEQIIKLLKAGYTPKQIAHKLKVKPQYVYTVRSKNKKKSSKIVEVVKETKTEFAHFAEPTIQTTFTQPDLVNHPPHYKTGGIETIEFIEAKDLNYRLGNVIKYVSRAGKKDSDPVQDLEKAAWYLQREIAARKNA